MDTNEPVTVVISSMPATNMNWLDVFTALLMPTIAIIAIYVAYQQYRINNQRLQHELYERRLRVFKSVRSFLSDICSAGDAGYGRTSQFYAETTEASFVFNPEIQQYIVALHEKAMKLHALQLKMYPSGGGPGLPIGKDRSKIADEHGDLLGWFYEQLESSKKLFLKHMKLI